MPHKTFTTHFRSIIAFGRITIISDEKEKRQALELLGRHFNPTDENKLQQEIEKSFQQVLVLRMDIEHLTGKEAIELVRANNRNKPIPWLFSKTVEKRLTFLLNIFRNFFFRINT